MDRTSPILQVIERFQKNLKTLHIYTATHVVRVQYWNSQQISHSLGELVFLKIFEVPGIGYN